MMPDSLHSPPCANFALKIPEYSSPWGPSVRSSSTCIPYVHSYLKLTYYNFLYHCISIECTHLRALYEFFSVVAPGVEYGPCCLGTECHRLLAPPRLLSLPLTLVRVRGSVSLCQLTMFALLFDIGTNGGQTVLLIPHMRVARSSLLGL